MTRRDDQKPFVAICQDCPHAEALDCMAVGMACRECGGEMNVYFRNTGDTVLKQQAKH